VKWHKDHDPRTFPVDFALPEFIYFKKFVNTGVPHVVLESSEFSSHIVSEIGRALRFHKYYQPEGTNVNFVQVLDMGDPIRLKIRTFERGVDAETLSCGSGATACALSYVGEKVQNDRSIEVETSGGKLYISILKNYDDIYLVGRVTYLFKGNYLMEGDT